MSPERELLTTAIINLKDRFQIPVYDTQTSDNENYPQIIVEMINVNPINHAKNEQRSQYSLAINYYDLTEGNHGLMLDIAYLIRDMLTKLQLKNYYCQCSGVSSRELVDNSTSQTLMRWNLTIDYQITEKYY